jgi:hypothetical protein
LGSVLQVRHARILVADGGGEEFQKPLGGLPAGGGDQARHQHAVPGAYAFQRPLLGWHKGL